VWGCLRPCPCVYFCACSHCQSKLNLSSSSPLTLSPSPLSPSLSLCRKCTTTCVFASHFQPNQSTRFAAVHKIFGASNVAKWLQELPLAGRRRQLPLLRGGRTDQGPRVRMRGGALALQQQVRGPVPCLTSDL